MTAPTVYLATIDDLIDRARALAEVGGRRILGITGAPGAGKTTVAMKLVGELGPEKTAFVPMDGFHLANATLVAWKRRDRKGAWDTFDTDGYVNLLGRLRTQDTEIVHAPDFDRDIDESIGSALPVFPEVPLVITEGNYLLSTRGSWAKVARLLDECWYIEASDETRIERLIKRHVLHGMTADAASAWARGTDQSNAELIEQGRGRASAIFVI